MNILQLAQAYAEAKVVAQAGGDVADVSRAWAALKEAVEKSDDTARIDWIETNCTVNPKPGPIPYEIAQVNLRKAIDWLMQESALRRMHDLSKDIGQEL